MKYLDAVEVVVGAKEASKDEQLADDVDEVENLRHQVESDEVITIAVTAWQAQVPGQAVFQMAAAAASVFPLVFQIMVEVANHVFYRFIATFRVKGILYGLGSFGQIVDIDARAVAEHAPYETGYVEQKSLHKQHDGHPLVIADVLLYCTRRIRHNSVRQIISIAYPTHLYHI